jgi:hypothetical protein
VGIRWGYFSVESSTTFEEQPNEKAAEFAEKRPVFLLLSQ